MQVPELGDSAARARAEQARQQALIAQLSGQTGQPFEVETAFFVYRDQAGEVVVRTLEAEGALTSRRPPTRHDVFAMAHVAASGSVSIEDSLYDGNGDVEADTGFIVYRMPDGTVIQNANLEVPVVPSREATTHDIQGMLFVVTLDTYASALIPSVSQATVQMLQMVGQQMAEAQEADRLTKQGTQ